MSDINVSLEQQNDFSVHLHADSKLQQEFEAARARAEQLDSELKRTRHTVEQLSNELNNLKTTRGIVELEEQLEEFRRTAGRSLDEFKDFLRTVQLQEFANVGEGWYRFREWFNNISAGAQTASEAIAEVKSEYSELIRSGSGDSSGTIDSQMLRTFTSTLQSVASSIDEVRAKLTEFQENGIRAIPTIQGSDNTISGLEQVKNTIKEMADNANGAYEPLTKLIGVMTDYANIDNTRLFSVEKAIAGLGEIGKGSYSVKSVENTINLLTRLQTLTRAGAIHFNVTGLEAFSNLSVRKASLNNLATFLPTIASVDVANLERLSHVDLSNFNNLDIKKASMNNLVQMIEAVNNMRVDTSWSNDLIQLTRSISDSVSQTAKSISALTDNVQSLQNNLIQTSNQKLLIDTDSIKQASEDSAKNIITNFEQAYYFVNNTLHSSQATEQLERIKSYLKENAGLATEFYRALDHSYSSNNVNQLISKFRSLCREESDATSAAQQFRDIIRQQFEITVPEMEKFNQRGFESLAVLKKFDKAMGGAGKYTGREFFDWLESSATKAQKALFDCEHGLNIVQGALKQLNDDAHTGLFVGYSDRLGEDSITLNQDGMKRLSAETKVFKESVDSSNQSLVNLRQILTSAFNISPQSFENGGVTVTLQQLQQIIDQAPYAQRLIERITHGFDRTYSLPDSQGIIEYLNGVSTAEQSLQTQTERLGEAINSSIASDAFDTKLVAINESINQVSNAISILANNIQSSIGQQNGAGSLNIDQTAFQGLETILNDINNVIQHTDIPKVSGEMSEMGEVAQRVAIYLGRYREALNDAANTKVHNSLTDLGIAAKDADVISQHLSDMHIKVKSITPEWETITKIIDEEIIKEQKLKQITVQGTTALGDAVNHVIKFNAETGDISKEITRATVKGKEFTQTIRELADGTKETNIETTVANLKEIDGLIKSIEKTNSSLNSSKNKVTDLLGGLSTTGKNREELDAINKKFDELTVATERLKTNRMTANQEDIDGLRKVQEELDALIRKSQERLRSESEANKKPKETKVIDFTVDGQKAEATLETIRRKLADLKEPSEEAKKSVSDLETAITAFNTATTQEDKQQALTNINKLITIANTRLSEQKIIQNKLEQANKRAETAERQAATSKEQALKRALALLKQIEQAESNWTAARKGKSKEEYSYLSTYATSLRQYMSDLESGKLTVKDFVAKMNQLSVSFQGTGSVIRANGEDVKSFGERVRELGSKFSAWFGVTRIIMRIYSTLRQMVSASIEVDNAMTQLQIVTKESDQVMSKFGDTAADAAKRIGSSVTDFLSSATTFARLGYSLNESSQLAEYTAMLQNVGNIDVAQAQDAITSIVKAYSDIDTNQIESVMDKLVSTGNGFPISVGQIAEGMTNASAALSAAGNSFDQSVALLTAANAATQNAAKASTGLRTIAARIRKTKTELDDLGETMETADYDKIVQQLTHFNVSLTDVNGEYRSTYDIMADIAAKWNDMTSMEQAALAEALSGNRQQQIFYSIINNFKEASGAMDAMSSSAGTLKNAYSTYMESTTAHVNQFKASFQDLSSNLFKSDLLKFFIDLGTHIVNAMNGLQKVHILLPTIVAIAMAINGIRLAKRLAESTAKINVLTAATIKEKAVTESLKNSVAALTIKERERFAADIQSAVASGKLSDEEAKQILTTLGLATADGTLTVANKSLAGSFKTLMASIPVWGWIALGVSVLADAIIWLSSSVSSTSDNIRSLEESFAQTQNEMRQISDEFKNLKESADETIPRFSELAKGVDDFGKNISLTDEEYKEFLSLNNKIAEMFPQLNMGMDENGNYMLALSYSADTLRESLEQLLEVQRQEANEALAKKMPQNINDVLGVAKEYSNQIKDIKSDIEVIQSGVFVKSVDTGDLNVLSNIQAKAEYDDFVEYLRKKGIEVEEIIDSTPGGTVYTAKWDKTSDASTNLVIGSLKKIDDLESRITSKWKTINPSINAWLQSDYLYNDMNSQMQQVAQTMAKALDFNALGLVTDNGEDTADNIQTYITKYIINPLYSSSDEVKTAFKDSMSLFESGEISETEFADRMKVAFDKLKQGMDDNEVTEFTNAFVKGFNAIGIAGDDFDSVADAIVESWGKISKAGGDSDSSGGLSIQQYSEDIKKAQDAISPLLDAYNKLQKGEMSNNDIVTLIADKFPALIAYTNDLSAGVKQLASEELDKLKSKLNEIDKSQLSEDDLSAYETFIGYIDRLNDGFNSTLAYYEKIKSTTKSVSDSISTLIGLSKEIEANDGLSLSSVEKILSDETLTSLRPYLNDVKAMLPIINGLIEDQKQAYEDLYNEQQRLVDPDAYIEASRQKQKEDENAFQNSIKRINEQIAKFKEKYGIDLSNWEQLSDGKKTVLQNTNAELLSKQSKLVNDFANYYNVDLKNFKDTTEAKAAILKNFRNSTALAQASQIAIEKGWLHNYQGNVLLDGEEARKEISSVLQPLGLTIDDFTHYLTNGSFTVATDERLTKQLNEILNAYTIAPTTWDDMTKNIGASGGSSGSSSKEKTWFEEQYAYHNHLVNMEQETEKSYLDWLDGAYKEAYRQGIIDLDAYYKYEEEVYKGRKKLTGDSVSWFEQQYKQHQHYLKMEQEDDADYLKWLNSAYQRAYKEGLLTLDEYRKYREEVYEGVKRLRDEAESAIKSLIDIRINMLKEDVNKEKEAIDKRLKNLKEFYDKQKELLQDKYDKEKYLDEQAEKRKKVSDVQAQIEALRMDDSAKAQKRRVELTKDLQEAQKDLTDFEKEHTFNEAKDQLDKLYENQEKVLNKQTEALDKKLSSPQELYEQALNDIRNGSQNLYGQMIEWNNLYGDGIRDTIKKAWEEAYKAEKQYFNYTGTHFNGVNLSNATGYVKGVSGYASGTSHAIAGIHKVDEQGVETIFQSADGQRYRMFSSGEKVLNASASDFLYKFANKGREILDKLFNGTSHSYNNVVPGVVANNIQLGDIVIQGNADKSTVSEIRRAQRDSLEQMLKQLNRLK